MPTLEIITPRRRVEFVEYNLSFQDARGSGYSFPCDEEGNLLNVEPWSLSSAWFDSFPNRAIRFHAWGNLTRAIAGYHAGELTLDLERYDHHYTEDATARCVCGGEVTLDPEDFWGVECDRYCGRIYNGSGQELAPRNQWEEREYDDDVHTIAERLHGYDD